MLIVLAIVSIIAILLSRFLSTSLRISARETLTLEVEQTCHFLLNQVESALRNSGTAGISYLESPQWVGVAVNPTLDVTSEGDLVWAPHQTFFLWSPQQQALYKQVRHHPSALLLLTPARYSPTEMKAAADENGRLGARIGRGVDDFQVKNERVDGSGRLIKLSIQLTRPVPNDLPRRFRLSRSMVLMN